jgi:dihydrofolate synthase/folylpolyglutamate synthase
MNKYKRTTDYLFKLHRIGIKLGLDNIRTLLNTVGNPQDKWPAIHLAGTNGKGSTAAMLESILINAGYKVGLYTSPHLINFTERIRINRQVIPRQDVVYFTQKLIPLVEKIQPSFFEVTTALAFWYFARENVDIAIIETGMGGRLDSTNVVHPLITVITPVDYDHQYYLGNTIEQIAAEKGGIIKEGIPCITNNRNPAVLATLSQICAERGVEFINVFDNGSFLGINSELQGTRFSLSINGRFYEDLEVNLPGEYQLENILLAMGTIDRLRHTIDIPENAIIEGLKSVYWPGRLHWISSEPNIIIDVSHNPAGFYKTLSFIGQFFSKNKINVTTFLQEDKDFQKIGDLLINSSQKIFVVDLKSGKPLNPQTLLEYILNKEGNAKILSSFEQAKEIIYRSIDRDELWLIIGSHYLAGEAYQHILSEAFLQPDIRHLS